MYVLSLPVQAAWVGPINPESYPAEVDSVLEDKPERIFFRIGDSARYQATADDSLRGLDVGQIVAL